MSHCERDSRSFKTAELIEAIPDPQAVRERIGDTLREAKLLRQLLRVAERAEHERQNRKAVNHGD